MNLYFIDEDSTSNFLKQNKNTSGFTLGYSYINLICGYIEKGCGTLTITKNIYVKIIDGKLIIFESNEDSIDSEKKLSSVPITELLTHPVNGFIIKVVDFNKFLKEYDSLFNKSDTGIAIVELIASVSESEI